MAATKKNERKQRKAQFTEESTAGTAFTKAAGIYLDLVEKSAPKVNQAMNDLYDFWFGSFETVIDVQKTALETIGISSKTLDKSEAILKQSVKEAVNAQKKASEISTKAYLEIIKIIQNEINVA